MYFVSAYVMQYFPIYVMRFLCLQNKRKAYFTIYSRYKRNKKQRFPTLCSGYKRKTLLWFQTVLFAKLKEKFTLSEPLVRDIKSMFAK